VTDQLDDDPREAGASKGPDAFRTISEVAEDLGLPQHVLRFWETRFPQIKPIKRGGGRRYYRPGDVELLRGVKQLLYGEGYTIRGVQRILREQGGRKLAQAAGVSAGLEPAQVDRSEPEFYAPRRDEPPVPDLADKDEGREAEPFYASPVIETEDIHGPSEPVSIEPAPSRPGLSTRQTSQLAAALEELNACRRLLDGWS
jgi:DNA-binding transcriptional MerR regulator